MARAEQNPDPNAFNMTILALKTSRYANAVSELHGRISRRNWHSLWPDKPADEVPISHITNGVHTRTWMSSMMKDILDENLGEDWRYRLSTRNIGDGFIKYPTKPCGKCITT